MQRTFALAATDRDRHNLHFFIAWEFTSLGRLTEAEGEYRQAVRAALAARDLRSAVVVLDALLWVASRTEKWRSMEAYSRLARRLCKRTGDREQEIARLNDLSWARLRLGRPAAAARTARQALELTTDPPATRSRARALTNLGLAHMHLLQFGQAAETLRWEAAMWRALNNAGMEATSLSLLKLANDLKEW